MDFFHEGHRALQSSFGSTALADRLEQKTLRKAFTDEDAQFIEAASYFFLATADADGRPDCSYKGGHPGFVRIVAPDRLIFPDYDGNGMFRSLGNLSVNPSVGLLFIRMSEAPKRLRVNGRAVLTIDHPARDDLPGAQAVVEVTVEQIFPNCPRYIHDLRADRLSNYVPKSDAPPIEPAWKEFDDFKDVVPKRKA